MQDRRPGHIGPLGGVRLGGAKRDLVSLDSHVDQPAQRLRQALQLVGRPGAVARHVKPRPPGSAVQVHRDLVAARRGHRLERESCVTGPGRDRHATADALELGLDAVTREDRRRDLGEQLCLALARGRGLRAALCLGGALPRNRREAPHNHCRNQQHDQLHEVLRMRDRKLVARRDVEEVERQHPEHGRRQRRQVAAGDRHREHGQQVDAAEVRSRSDPLERGDHQGRGDDGAEHCERIGRHTARGRPTGSGRPTGDQEALHGRNATPLRDDGQLPPPEETRRSPGRAARAARSPAPARSRTRRGPSASRSPRHASRAPRRRSGDRSDQV